VYNEVISLVLISILFCFTDLITYANSGKRTRDFVGYLFSLVLMANILTHLSFMVSGSVSNLKKSWMRRRYIFKNREQLKTKYRAKKLKYFLALIKSD